VIIHDFFINRTVICPPEADAVLIVHPDGVQPPAIANKPFQLIAWRDAQVNQRSGRIQRIELADSNLLP
jgi:hypothetical protein